MHFSPPKNMPATHLCKVLAHITLCDRPPNETFPLRFPVLLSTLPNTTNITSQHSWYCISVLLNVNGFGFLIFPTTVYMVNPTASGHPWFGEVYSSRKRLCLIRLVLGKIHSLPKLNYLENNHKSLRSGWVYVRTSLKLKTFWKLQSQSRLECSTYMTA